MPKSLETEDKLRQIRYFRRGQLLPGPVALVLCAAVLGLSKLLTFAESIEWLLTQLPMIYGSFHLIFC